MKDCRCPDGVCEPYPIDASHVPGVREDGSRHPTSVPEDAERDTRPGVSRR